MISLLPLTNGRKPSTTDPPSPTRAYDHAMGQNFVRRVVTGIDASGRHVITSDDATPNTFASDTVAVSEVLWCDGPDISIHGAIDRSSPGRIAVRDSHRATS